MNTPIERLQTAAATSQRDPLRQPDLFERCVWMVDEMSATSASVAAQLVNLRVARAQRDIDAFERANAEIGKLLTQSENMNAVLADQIAGHRAGRGK